MPDSSTTNSQVPQPLDERSLLHDRYIVGPVAGTPTQYIVNYVGFDKQTRQKVVIRELYPTQFCARSRDGKSVVALSTELQVSFQTVKDKFLSQSGQYPVIPHGAIHSGVEVFEENGTAYQITDYVTGIDLTTFLARKGNRLGEHEALQLFLPLLDGLQQVHDFGLHHGYIGPDAVRVVKSGDDFRFVLMNLGIPPKKGARVVPGYTPPEVTVGDSHTDKLSDIYGISATLYRTVTGQTPPPAADRMQNAALPQLSLQELDLSKNMQSGILAGMYVNPADRIRTAMNLKLAILGESEDNLIPDKDLTEADESLFDGVESAPVDAAQSTSSSKNTKLLIGLIVGTLLVFFVPAWFLIISPILSFTSQTEQAFQDFANQMEQMEQMDPTIETEEPTVKDPAQMSQREIEVQQMLEQGEGQLTMGNMSEAIASFKQAVAMMPTNPDAHLALGRAYVKANQTREAIQSFEKVLRLAPNNGEAYGSLGFIYYDSDRQARAYDHFRKAVALGDQVTISFLQAESNKGNATAQSVLRDNGINW